MLTRPLPLLRHARRVLGRLLVRGLALRLAPPQRPDLPRHPLRAMALCGALSLLLWLVLTLRQTTTATLEAQTVVAALPRGEALASPVPETVQIVVEGTGYRLLPLVADPPRLPISATQRDVLLDAQLPALPPGVRLVGVSPRTLRLDTEASVTRRVPVALRSMVSFTPSYNFAGAVRVMPDSVEVTGARSVVEALAAWPTETLPLPRLRDSVRTDVALLDTLAGLVAKPRAGVRVVVPVAAFSGQEREIDVHVAGEANGDARGGEAPRYAFDPPSVRVRFRVRLGQGEAALRARDFTAVVDPDDLRRDVSGLVRVRVRLPAGVEVQEESVQAIPDVVRYYRIVRE